MDALHTTAARAQASKEPEASETRPTRFAREARADFEREIDRAQRARTARRERARAERREQAAERDRKSDRLHGPRAEARDDARSRASARAAQGSAPRPATGAEQASQPLGAPVEVEESVASEPTPRAAARDERATTDPTLTASEARSAPNAALASARPLAPQPPRSAGGATPRGDAPVASTSGDARAIQADSQPAAAHERSHAPARAASSEATARTPRPPPADARAGIEAPLDLAAQIRLQLAPGAGAATIQLAPASLGRVVIRLSVERGRVRAELVAERRETLVRLGRELAGLRGAFASHGLKVDEMALVLARSARDFDAAAGPGPARAGESTAPTNTALAARIARAAGVDVYA